MNLYAAVILAALLVDYLLSLVANALNLGALRSEPPEALAEIYDPASYRKSQSYTRAATRFGFVTSTFNLAVLLIFWFAGGFNRLDLWLRDFELSSWLTGLLFFGVLGLGKGLLGLPFTIYSTFVIEERFGRAQIDLATKLMHGIVFNLATKLIFLATTIKFKRLAVNLQTLNLKPR